MPEKPNEAPEYQEDVQPVVDVIAKPNFETVKHLTTLSAGSIVLIATFMKDIFPRDSTTGALAVGVETKVLIAGSFILFGLSLVAASVFMFLYSAGLILALRSQIKGVITRIRYLPFEVDLSVVPDEVATTEDKERLLQEALSNEVKAQLDAAAIQEFYRILGQLITWVKWSLLSLVAFVLGVICFGSAVLINLL